VVAIPPITRRAPIRKEKNCNELSDGAWLGAHRRGAGEMGFAAKLE
jgi:hypothetical protein